MQRDDSKNLLDARFNFGSDFEEYIRKYLSGIDAENDDKYDLLTNKNSKYLFSCYMIFLSMKNIEMLRVGHTKISNNFLGAVKIQERDWQYLIERIVARSENLDLTDEITENIHKLPTKLIKIIKFVFKYRDTTGKY